MNGREIMSIFYKSELKTKNGLLEIQLFINKKSFAEEYSIDFDEDVFKTAKHMRKDVLEYIEKNYPTIPIQVATIMIGKVPYSTFLIKK